MELKYNKNRQKLLFMVQELHKRGFERLRVVPSLSPSGMSWRCEFVSNSRIPFTASNWITKFEEAEEKIKYTPQKLADIFSEENFDFLKECEGDNKEYVEWYSAMIESLREGELPYAFADYFSPTDFWQTSNGNKIKILPGEITN
jgi:hypothetical protein